MARTFVRERRADTVCLLRDQNGTRSLIDYLLRSIAEQQIICTLVAGSAEYDQAGIAAPPPARRGLDENRIQARAVMHAASSKAGAGPQA